MQVMKGDLKMPLNTTEAAYENVHRALLTGLLSNIGFRHEQYEYIGARGLKFFIFPGSGQHKAKPKWIMAAEQVETSKVYARTVAKIEPEWIEAVATHLVKHNYSDPHWEKKGARCMVSQRTLLYGLTLQTGRKIPYDHVDAKTAREMFIQAALVDHDYHSNAPFYVANQKLLEEVGMIQHKGRRVDLVEDEQWLYSFYDHKLPPEVFSGVTLDTWRKTVERDNPKLLFVTSEDLTREQENPINDWDYPDSKKIGTLTIPLQYRFEPGHNEDGVTAIIPVHQLNQLSTAPFDWLVLGMLEEKCIAMIKSLPKQIRKHFVPVPETVKRCLEIEPDFKGTVQEWLGNRLRKLTSEAIPLNAWSMDSLPEHLKMNFRIVEDGKLLDYGRDLKKLQAKYAVEAGDSFDQIAADELNYTGCIQWAFEDLPETYAFIQKGQDFIGFPALVDEGDAVGVKIFDTQIKAALQHSAGLMRLFALQLRKECSYVSKNLAPSAAVELSYQRLPKHPIVATSQTTNTYKDDMLTLILHSVFIDGKTIRTQAAFEQSLRDNKGQLMTVANEASKITLDIMTLYTVIKTALQRLNANDPLAKDLNEQLDLLIYAGFIRHTPYTQIKAIPRYLKAAHYRLDKYDNNAQKVQEVNRYAVRYWKDVEKKTKKDTVIPEHDAFRWALEEFRVSLFAQQLKTAYPVSAKRMDKLWDEY
jgi:ATP-dependent helicase HrpA